MLARDRVVIIHADGQMLSDLVEAVTGAGFNVEAFTAIPEMRLNFLCNAGPTFCVPRLVILGEGCEGQERSVLDFLSDVFSSDVSHLTMRPVGRSFATDFAGQPVFCPLTREILSALTGEVDLVC